jgi:hypothetical protein
MFFLSELMLLSWVQRGYVCTGHFWLDIMACVSLLGDTSIIQELLQSDAVVAGKGSRLGRMARMASRSSRLTRLARAARVARISRLLPRIQHVLNYRSGGGVSDLAKVLLTRRLWRIFNFLDEDHDGAVTEKDVTVCKATLLSGFVGTRPVNENAKQQYQMMKSMVKSTVKMIRNQFGGSQENLVPMDDVENPNKSSRDGVLFSEFTQKLLDGPAGGQLKNCCIAEIDKGGGFWNITHKLTEKTAIKVCIGVIVLLIILPFLEADVVDRALQSGITQLHGLAEMEYQNDPVDYVFCVS